MDIAELGVIAGTLVATVYPITQSIKTQVQNIKVKKYESVGFFIIGMIVTISSAFILKGSNLVDFNALHNLNNIDTIILGIYAGLVITGGKDILSTFSKGKDLGNSLKEELSKLNADEVADVAFEVMQDKGVVFGEDLNEEQDFIENNELEE